MYLHCSPKSAPGLLSNTDCKELTSLVFCCMYKLPSQLEDFWFRIQNFPYASSSYWWGRFFCRWSHKSYSSLKYINNESTGASEKKRIFMAEDSSIYSLPPPHPMPHDCRTKYFNTETHVFNIAPLNNYSYKDARMYARMYTRVIPCLSQSF